MARRRPTPADSATPVRKRPSLDFSLTGLVYCSMMMFMGLAAVNTQANLLFGVFGLMIGVLLIAGVISRAVLRRLRGATRLACAAEVRRAADLSGKRASGKLFERCSPDHTANQGTPPRFSAGKFRP